MGAKHRIAAALAAVLGSMIASTASAETPSGLYFNVMGGATSVDMGGSQEDFDEGIAFPIAEAFFNAGLDVLDFESSLDDSDIGWGVQVGYRFNRFLAAEVGYVNLGEALYEAVMTVSDGFESLPVEVSARIQTQGPTAAVLGLLPVSESFDVHAKAGLYFSDTRLRTRVRDVEFAENFVHSEIDASDRDLFAAVGGAWNINERYSLRFEFQRFFDVGDEDSGEGDVDLLAVSVLFR
jgi:OOP family OmpA-OmpF porin